MIKNKFTVTLTRVVYIYIVIGAIVSYLITFDLNYPLGMLIGGIASLLGFRNLNKSISNMQLGNRPIGVFVSGYIMRMLFYTVVLAIAAYTNAYAWQTTIIGLFAVKIGLYIAGKRVGESDCSN